MFLEASPHVHVMGGCLFMSNFALLVFSSPCPESLVAEAAKQFPSQNWSADCRKHRAVQFAFAADRSLCPFGFAGVAIGIKPNMDRLELASRTDFSAVCFYQPPMPPCHRLPRCLCCILCNGTRYRDSSLPFAQVRSDDPMRLRFQTPEARPSQTCRLQGPDTCKGFRV